MSRDGLACSLKQIKPRDIIIGFVYSGISVMIFEGSIFEGIVSSYYNDYEIISVITLFIIMIPLPVALISIIDTKLKDWKERDKKIITAMLTYYLPPVIITFAYFGLLSITPGGGWWKAGGELTLGLWIKWIITIAIFMMIFSVIIGGALGLLYHLFIAGDWDDTPMEMQ